MAESTGPIAAVTLITYGNAVVLNNRDVFTSSRILVAGAVVGGALFAVEQWSPKVARAFAWMVLAAVIVTRVDPAVPSPVESLLSWWREGYPDERQHNTARSNR